MSERTQLLVMDIMPRAGNANRIVWVQILAGEPKIGMEFVSPTVAGRWKLVGFGSSPMTLTGLDSAKLNVNLSLCSLESGDIRAGEELVEAM